MYVIFDLDGTLADCTHRLHHIRDFERGTARPNWVEFYQACAYDAPILHGINTMRAFREAGASIEIWTGRSDIVRMQTREWMTRAGVPHVDMTMRPDGDHRPDHILKGEWLAKAPIRPDLVFEDRARVVEMWRAAGIPCYQVARGDF